MPKQLYALDLGNGDYKVASTTSKEVQAFPALLGRVGSYSNFDFGANNARIDSMTLKREGKEYAVGNMALKNSSIRNHDITEDKYVSNETMILSHAAMAMLTESSYTIGNIVIGLPLHKLNSSKEVIRAYQGNQFGGSIGYYGEYGNSRNVSIDKAVVVAQPHGTLFNLILNEKGQIADKELAKSGIGVYDIGFKTNDGIVFKNLEQIGRLNVNSKNGMFVAYDEICQKVNNMFGLELKAFEIPEVVKTGKIKGQKIDHIINDSFYQLASNIILELKAKWNDAWEIEQIVFTGGGAVLLRPYLEQAFDAMYKDAKSNAEGMLKYAIRLWGRDIG